MESTFRVSVGSAATAADYHPARDRSRRALFICGPSAGGHRGEAGMLRLAEVLTRVGLDVVIFDFLYRERGLRRPDPMPSLQQCFASVVEQAVDRFGGPVPVVLGGRSMGGRVASMIVADGLACDGLLLFAYPLHPAGEPERLRSAHLARIAVPTVCLNGTRDRLCRRDLMEAAVASLGRTWRMHWLEGADHSFRVPKSSGRSEADVLAELGAATSSWLDSLEHVDRRRPSAGVRAQPAAGSGEGRK